MTSDHGGSGAGSTVGPIQAFFNWWDEHDHRGELNGMSQPDSELVWLAAWGQAQRSQSAALEAAQGEIERYKRFESTSGGVVVPATVTLNNAYWVALNDELQQARERIKVLEADIVKWRLAGEAWANWNEQRQAVSQVVEAAKAIDRKDRSFAMDDALNALHAAEASDA